MTKGKQPYRGNKKIKPVGEKVEFTAQQLEDYIKCSTDIMFFARNYMKIVSLDGGEILFDPYLYQEKLIKKCEENRFVICKLPRQAGKTTAITCIMLWHVLFHENWNGAILANKAATARKILKRIKFAYECLPRWLQQGVDQWNEGSINLENGSTLYAAATSASSIRGDSTNLVYLDEFALVDNNIQEDFYTSTYPTITSGKTTKLIITSTPQGLDLFYKLWIDSEQGRNQFERVDIHWNETPGRDEEWRINTIRNTSERSFQQEYETEFLGSSLTLIAGTVLRKMVPLPEIQVSKKENEDAHLKIYEWPKEKHIYVMLVDSATGIDQDYSAFIIIDVTETPYRIVAIYKCNTISILAFPTVVTRVARRYNNAYALIETNNNLGTQVCEIMHNDFEYDNIIWTKSMGRKGKTVSMGFGEGTKPEMGIFTSIQTKAVGCSNIKTIIEGEQLPIIDYWCISELSRFSQKGKSYEAEDGNDDLAMCLVLFGWLVAQDYIKELNNIDFRTNMLAGQADMIDNDLVPFGMIVDGSDIDPDEPTDKDGNIIEFDKWLLG
jgi:hypothetical protein